MDAFSACGYALVGISADDCEHRRAMLAEIGDAFPLYSDPSAAAIVRLGLSDTDEQVSHLIARPATFIVDGDGLVRYRYLSRSPDDRPKVELLLLAVERLAGERTGTT